MGWQFAFLFRNLPAHNYRSQMIMLHRFFITHTPSLSSPSRAYSSAFFKVAISRSTVRELTDNISDICLAEIDGDCFIRLIILC